MIPKNIEIESENDTADSPKSLGVERVAPDRIRQVQNICWLLDREATNSEHSSKNEFLRQLFSANSFIAGLCAAFVFLISIIGLTLWVSSRPSLKHIPDYRWGETYESKTATALLVNGNQVQLATRGNGIQSFDQTTHFFQSHTVASSKNGLLSNDVLEIQQGEDGQIYFLCNTGESNGICSAQPTFNKWKTLIAADRFPGLSDDFQEQITDVLKVGDDFWIATRDAGIGVYSSTSHRWISVFKANETELLSNQVWDLDQSSAGDLWIATSSGLNQVTNGDWKRFTATEGLLSNDIRQLSFKIDQLWYRTHSGGIGRQNNGKWEIVRSEDQWGNHDDDSVALLSDSPETNVTWWIDKTGEVAAYDREIASWKVYSTPLEEHKLTSFAVGKSPQITKTNLWIGTDNGLISANASESDQLRTKTHFKNHNILDVQANTDFVSSRLTDANLSSVIQVRLKSGEWVKRLGNHQLPDPEIKINDLAIDSEQKVTWFATSKGLFPYHLTDHDWMHRAGGEPRMITGKNVINVERDGKQLAFLDADFNLQRWAQNTKNQVPEIALGEGEFPGDVQSITAVARDQNNLLWIGTEGYGLFVYDTANRSWQRSTYNSKRIEQIVNTKRNTWVLADGQLRVAPNSKMDALVKTDISLDEVHEIFTHPDAEHVVALGADGRVVTISDQQDEKVIVGDAIKNIDTASIQAVGVLNDNILFAGSENWIYNTSTRSWKTVATKNTIRKIIASDDSLWTLTSSGEIFEFNGESFNEIPKVNSTEVVDFEMAGDSLLLLNKDGSLRGYTVNNKQSKLLLTKTEGPLQSAVSEKSHILAIGDDLYVTAGAKNLLWKYSWVRQNWQQVTHQGVALQGVSQVISDGNNIYALTTVKGELFRIDPDTGLAQNSDLTEIKHISSSSLGLLKTDSDGDVQRMQDGDWQPLIDQTNSGLENASQFFDVVETSLGFLFSTDGGTSLLKKSLSSWQTIQGNQVFTKLVASKDGSQVWGKDPQGNLAYFNQQNRAWLPVHLEANEIVSSLTINSSANDAELYLTTQNKSVYLVRNDNANRLWQPTKSKQSLSSAVSVVSVDGGFLWLFKNSEANFYNVRSKEWGEISLPSQPVECVNWQDAQVSSLALLDSRGQVHVAIAQQPLKWKLIATGISQLKVAAGDLFTLSSDEKILKRWVASDQTDSLLANQALPDLGQKLLAIEEIPSVQPNAPSQLVIVGESASAIYSPLTHRWTQIPAKLHSLRKHGQSVLGLDNNNQLIRIEWDQDRLKFSSHVTPEITDFTIFNNQISLRFADGTISSLDEKGNLNLQVGKQLPRALKISKIQSITSDGHSPYIVTDRGETFRYQSQTRSWEEIPKLSNISQINITSKTGWAIKKEETDHSLLHLSLVDNNPNLTPTLTPITAWNFSPTGEADTFQEIDNQRSWKHFDQSGEIVAEYSTNLGPALSDITAYSVNSDVIVMLTKKGSLHIHNTAGGIWVPVLMNEPVVDFKLYNELLLCRTNKKELYALQVDEDSGNWISQKIVDSADAYDYLDSQLAWLSADTLSLAPFKALSIDNSSLKTRKLLSGNLGDVDLATISLEILLSKDQLFLFSKEQTLYLPWSLEGDLQGYDIAAQQIARSGDTAIISTANGLYSFQNGQWRSTAGEFTAKATSPALVLTPENGSISVLYPTVDGSSVSTSYVNGWFDILTHMNQGLQSSFAFSNDQLYLITSEGVIQRNQEGLRKLNIDRTVDELVYGFANKDKTILLATAGEVAFEINGDEVKKLESYKDLFTYKNQLKLDNDTVSFKVDDSENSATFEWIDKQQSQRLILQQGGFEDDQIIDFATNKDSVFYLTHHSLYSINKDGIKTEIPTERHQVQLANSSLVEGSDQVFLVADGQQFLVRNNVLEVTTDSLENSLLTLESKDWSIAPINTENLRVTLKRERPSLTEFSINQGFLWDEAKSFIVSPKTILLTTADGVTRYQSLGSNALDVNGWQDVSNQTWKESIVTSTGQILVSIANEWFQFDSEKIAWVKVGELPQAVNEERYLIAKSRLGQWVISDDFIQFKQITQSKQEVITPFQEDGLSSSIMPLTVIPVTDGHWWVNPNGLRKYDQEGILIFEQKLDPPVKSVSVESYQDQWYLQLSSGSEPIYLTLGDQGWRQVDIRESPFRRNSVTLKSESLQALNNGEGIEVFVKPKLSQTWIPANWNKSEGKFDFQSARKAFLVGEDLFIESTLGSVVWQKLDKEYQLLDWQPSVTELNKFSDSEVSGIDQTQRLYSFNRQLGWGDAKNRIDRSILGHSDRWLVQKKSEDLLFNLSIETDKKQVSLMLDEKGGFQHQYINRIAPVPGKSNFVLISKDLVSQYDINDTWENLELENLWTFENRIEPVDIVNVLYDKEQLILELAETSLQLENMNWSPIQDFKKLDELRTRLWKSETWDWRHDPRSGLTGTKQSLNQSTLYRLNQSQDRFERDTIGQVGLSSRTVWLSSATGLQAVDTNDLSSFDVSPALNQNFHIDSDSQQLIAIHSRPSSNSFLLIDGDEEGPPQIQIDKAERELHQLQDTLYSDPEWKFSSSGIVWHGQPTQITDSEFTQDRFDKFFSNASSWYLTSQLGLSIFSVDRNRKIVFKDFIAAPKNMTNPEYSHSEGHLVAFDQQKNILKWDEDKSAWIKSTKITIDPQVTEQNEWKFIHQNDGDFLVQLDHQTNQIPLDELLSSDRRFLFDEMQHQLLNGSELWLAGKGGVCLRNPDSGQVVNWWREGFDLEGKPEELGQLSKIAKFQAASDVDVLSIAIQSQDGRSWKYNRKDDHWQRSESSLWALPEGELVTRVSIADQIRGSEGKLHLVRTGVRGVGGPVLTAGRLTTDISKNFIIRSDEVWRSTPTGVVRTNLLRPHDSTIFSAAGDDATRLNEVELIVQDSGSDDMFALLATGQISRWDPTSQTFLNVQAADNDLISNSQILADSEFWTWTKWRSEVNVNFPILESQKTPNSLVRDERWSFDIVNSFRIVDSQILTTTPVGILSIDSVSHQYIDWESQAVDEKSKQFVEFKDDLIFLRGDSLTASSENDIYRLESGSWIRETKIAQLQRYEIKAGEWTWDVLPIDQGGFSVRLLNERQNLVEQHEVLKKFRPDQLRDIKADGQRLWLALDHGLFVLKAESKIPSTNNL